MGKLHALAYLSLPGLLSAAGLAALPDVLPTLAELAGVKDRMPDVVTGISFVPELLGAGRAGRAQEAPPFLYWEYADIDWKAVRYLHDETLRQAVRSGDWKAAYGGASSASIARIMSPTYRPRRIPPVGMPRSITAPLARSTYSAKWKGMPCPLPGTGLSCRCT